MRAPGYLVLFVGSFLVGAPAPALAVMHVECGVATTCVTDTTTGTRTARVCSTAGRWLSSVLVLFG